MYLHDKNYLLKINERQKELWEWKCTTTAFIKSIKFM